MSEGGSFEEGGEEEVPLEVGQGEQLFGGRHRKPKAGDDPSFYIVRGDSRKILLHPSGYRERMVLDEWNPMQVLIWPSLAGLEMDWSSIG